MMDRTHLVSFLKLNGLNIESKDDEIKSVLLSANWHEIDIDTALSILRKDPKTIENKVEGLYAVFRSDDGHLKPETITSLLGIHVEAKDMQVQRPKASSMVYSIYKVFEIAFVSVVLASLIFVGALWYFKSGIFHIAAS